MSTISNELTPSDYGYLSGLFQQDAADLINLRTVLAYYRGDENGFDAIYSEVEEIERKDVLKRVPPAVIGEFLKSDDVAFGVVEFLKCLPSNKAAKIRDIIIQSVLKDLSDMSPSKEVVLGRLALFSMWYDSSYRSNLNLTTLAKRIHGISGWDCVAASEIADLMRSEAFEEGRMYAFTHLPSKLFTQTTLLSQNLTVYDKIERVFPQMMINSEPEEADLDVIFPGAGLIALNGLRDNDMTAYHYLHSMTCVGAWDLMYQKEPESWISVRFNDQHRVFITDQIVLVDQKWRDGIKALLLVKRSIVEDEIVRLCAEELK